MRYNSQVLTASASSVVWHTVSYSLLFQQSALSVCQAHHNTFFCALLCSAVRTAVRCCIAAGYSVGTTGLYDTSHSCQRVTHNT
jgi:hypothetical protein